MLFLKLFVFQQALPDNGLGLSHSTSHMSLSSGVVDTYPPTAASLSADDDASLLHLAAGTLLFWFTKQTTT